MFKIKNIFIFMLIQIFLGTIWNISYSADGKKQSQPANNNISDRRTAKETVFRSIPQSAIDKAKKNLRIAYFHTSHGGRVIEGMTGLLNYKSGDIKKYAFTTNGSIQNDKLCIKSTIMDLSTGDSIQKNGRTQWYNETKKFLNNPSNSQYNVVMWSWCNPEGHDHNKYIIDMEKLIEEYPKIKFVFMTGHPNGDGENPSIKSAYHCHKLITKHCREKNRFCLDYYDIETHDMDDVYKARANDNGSADGKAFYAGWASVHKPGIDYFNCACVHATQPITCNRIAYSAWWLWAKLAGWDRE